jgi:hypothetical protein
LAIQTGDNSALRRANGSDEAEPSSEDRRTCSRCGNAKPISEFYKKGERREAICKCCKKEKQREYRRVGKESGAQPLHEGTSQSPPDRGIPRPIQELSADDFKQVVKVFEILKRWRDEDCGERDESSAA